MASSQKAKTKETLIWSFSLTFLILFDFFFSVCTRVRRGPPVSSWISFTTTQQPSPSPRFSTSTVFITKKSYVFQYLHYITVVYIVFVDSSDFFCFYINILMSLFLHLIFLIKKGFIYKCVVLFYLRSCVKKSCLIFK